jgi:hypothetical protein
MPLSPEQTYLAERLQSAAGLGWSISAECGEPLTKSATPMRQAMQLLTHRILRLWLRCVG